MATVDGDAATVGPIMVTDLRMTELKRLVLAKVVDRWRIRAVEHVAYRPIEWGMPGLGEAYARRLDDRAGETLDWIDSVLVANPPGAGDATMRHQAIRSLDEVFHIRSAGLLDSVRAFLRKRVDRALDEMSAGGAVAGRVESGIGVWQLYNHGWVVETPNHRWAHDVCEGFGNVVMTEAQVDAVLDNVDAMFCSHWHRDHTSPVVLKRAVRKGLPVLVSPIQHEYAGAVLNALGDEADAVLEHLTVVDRGSTGEVAGLKYLAMPGHQDDLNNTMFLIEADGQTVLQTGDQWNEDDFAWIADIGDEHEVDLLLSWMVELKLYAEGVRPRVVIPGHENELGHLIEHREPYDQAFEKLRDVECDWHVMAWGERAYVPSRHAGSR